MLIIHIVLLQHPNAVYLPVIEVSDGILSLFGDGPAWKSDAELLQQTAFQNKFRKRQTLNTSGPSRYIYGVLLESSKLAIHLLKAMEHRFIYNLFHGSSCDMKGSASFTPLFWFWYDRLC